MPVSGMVVVEVKSLNGRHDLIMYRAHNSTNGKKCKVEKIEVYYSFFFFSF